MRSPSLVVPPLIPTQPQFFHSMWIYLEKKL